MNISYRPAQPHDYNNLLRWRNQKKVRDLSFNQNIITEQEHKKWLATLKDDPTRSVWIVEDEGEAIGVVQFYRHNLDKKSCWWGAYPVSESDLGKRNKMEVWTELEQTALDIAKSELSCKTLFCETFEKNSLVHAQHKRFGFEHIKTENRECNDRKEDVIIMKRDLNSQVKMIILGSANWDIAKDLYETEWQQWTGESLNITSVPFGQYKILLQSEDSLLNTKHDIILLAERFEDFLPRPFAYLTHSIQSDIEQRLSEWLTFIDLVRQKTSGTVFVLSLAPTSPICPSLSYNDYMNDDNWLKKLNNSIKEKVDKLADTYLISMDKIVTEYGQINADSGKYYNLGRVAYSNNITRRIGREIAAYHMSLQGKTSRVLVLDLDNTLWGGIIGEDGIENIDLGNDYPGNLYIRLQEAIKVLQDRGIILAICSKNDEQTALNVFHNHPSMIIKHNDIAALRINWQEKSKNLLELSNELSIGLASFSFLDDSPYERELIKRELTEVNVIEWEDDISQLPHTLLSHPRLQNATITKSDRLRANSYKKRSQIKELEQNSQSREKYLQSLKMSITLVDVSSNISNRVLQLISKTNQFNLTTRRHSMSDINNMVDSGASVYSISLEDKFSEQEIVGVVILVPSNDTPIIETFTLSCRVIGRDIEKAVVIFCMQLSRKNKYKKLVGEFIPTDKNLPASTLYADMGFSQEDDNFIWLSQESKTPTVDYITITELV